MNAQMMNQLVYVGEKRLVKVEEGSERILDKYSWSTAYITDIPIQTLTNKASSMIRAFIKRHFDDKEVQGFTVERNGMLGFWLFTIITLKEVTEFGIEEKANEVCKEDNANDL